MTNYPQSEAVAALLRRPAPPWRGLWKRLGERIGAERERRRQYRELTDYLASDHRAAKDLGLTSDEARNLWP